jgi:hypothetical protein
MEKEDSKVAEPQEGASRPSIVAGITIALNKEENGKRILFEDWSCRYFEQDDSVGGGPQDQGGYRVNQDQSPLRDPRRLYGMFSL